MLFADRNTWYSANNMHAAIDTYVRNGEHVARIEQVDGRDRLLSPCRTGNPALQPKKIIDFGPGTCGLLIRLLEQLPQATRIGIDLSASACQKAREIIQDKGLSHRLRDPRAG